MLQYLAWIFDIRLKSVLQEVIRIGVIKKILKYFRGQNIPSDQYQEIKEAIKSYLLKFELTTKK